MIASVYGQSKVARSYGQIFLQNFLGSFRRFQYQREHMCAQQSKVTFRCVQINDEVDDSVVVPTVRFLKSVIVIQNNQSRLLAQVVIHWREEGLTLGRLGNLRLRLNVDHYSAIGW